MTQAESQLAAAQQCLSRVSQRKSIQPKPLAKVCLLYDCSEWHSGLSFHLFIYCAAPLHSAFIGTSLRFSHALGVQSCCHHMHLQQETKAKMGNGSAEGSKKGAVGGAKGGVQKKGGAKMQVIPLLPSLSAHVVVM